MMITAKQEAQSALESLSEDATFEDIQYCIYVRQKVAEGLESAEAGRLLSHAEAKRRMSEWLER